MVMSTVPTTFLLMSQYSFQRDSMSGSVPNVETM
jgi:hypothetical protein